MNCTDQWLNTCNYTALQLGLVLVGTIFWNIAYYIIIRDGFKYQFVEMPFLAGASNLWIF
jgi:hypothetical protein